LHHNREKEKRERGRGTCKTIEKGRKGVKRKEKEKNREKRTSNRDKEDKKWGSTERRTETMIQRESKRGKIKQYEMEGLRYEKWTENDIKIKYVLKKRERERQTDRQKE
jgi:hypothetical protein